MNAEVQIFAKFVNRGGFNEWWLLERLVCSRFEVIMIKLKCPDHKSTFVRSDITKSESNLRKCVDNHYFNHCIQIVIPNALQKPDYLQNISDDDISYYLLDDLPVYELINAEFIKHFVKTGNLTCLSIETNVDRDNCVCLSPSGKLILNVNRETFHQLGLPSKTGPSPKFLERTGRYVVELDLMAPSFRPGKKCYQRAMWCLKNRLNLSFKMLLHWSPHKTDICGSSAAAYFAKKGYTGKLCHPRVNVDKRDSLKAPTVSPHGCESHCSYEEFFEWLGAVTSDCELNSSEFVSSLRCPEPNTDVGQIFICSLYGFFSSSYIWKLIDSTRCYLENKKALSWSSVTVHGFDDAPVTWNRNDHGYDRFGDNFYSCVLLPESKYWLHQGLGSYDVICNT